jgi:hypothetical protein
MIDAYVFVVDDDDDDGIVAAVLVTEVFSNDNICRKDIQDANLKQARIAALMKRQAELK